MVRRFGEYNSIIETNDDAFYKVIMINVFTNNEFGGISSGRYLVLHARRSFVWPGTEITQQGGGRCISSSDDNLIATSHLPSNKTQGVCHGAASGCSTSGHVLCTAPIPIAIFAAGTCLPPSLPSPSLLPPPPLPSLLPATSS